MKIIEIELEKLEKLESHIPEGLSVAVDPNGTIILIGDNSQHSLTEAYETDSTTYYKFEKN